jgi:hypothetical protein
LSQQKLAQTEVLNKAIARTEVLRDEKEKLEHQLEKAKVQVSHLIKEIGRWEASIAMRWKAEKKAKEASEHFILIVHIVMDEFKRRNLNIQLAPFPSHLAM